MGDLYSILSYRTGRIGTSPQSMAAGVRIMPTMDEIPRNPRFGDNMSMLPAAQTANRSSASQTTKERKLELKVEVHMFDGRPLKIYHFE